MSRLMRNAFTFAYAMAVATLFLQKIPQAMIVWLVIFMAYQYEAKKRWERLCELEEGIERVKAVKLEYEQLAQDARDRRPYQWTNN